MNRILALDTSGTPRSWIGLEEAVTYHVEGKVAWQVGEEIFVARGGYQKDGRQSIVKSAPIVAIRSASGFTIDKIHREVSLTNKMLFARDRHTCAYCGRTFNYTKLSRDHIHPRSRGGKDIWMNVVTACFDCNCDKDDMTLQESGMELLYLPYTPNHAEKLIMEGRNILADQMDFLVSRIPKHSRIL